MALVCAATGAKAEAVPDVTPARRLSVDLAEASPSDVAHFASLKKARLLEDIGGSDGDPSKRAKVAKTPRLESQGAGALALGLSPMTRLLSSSPGLGTDSAGGSSCHQVGGARGEGGWRGVCVCVCVSLPHTPQC
jgi:hypothetical protein